MSSVVIIMILQADCNILEHIVYVSSEDTAAVLKKGVMPLFYS